jgi:protein SCO1
MNAIRAVRCMTVGLLICAVGVGLFAYRADQLDDFGTLDKFDFLSSAGGHVTERALSGKVCVFGCFFTCCTTQCPVLTGSMARLQSELSNLPDVRLISLTVDPEHDTTEKLTAYAQTFGADPNRWLFLTGEQGIVESFVTKQLKQGVERNTGADAEPGNKFLHSERLILVDRAGHIRGFFCGTDATEVDKLRQAVKKLHG